METLSELLVLWEGNPRGREGPVMRHYCDVKMGAMASQITSLTIVYSTVYSTQTKKTSKLRVIGLLCGELIGDRWIPRTNGQ